MVPISTPRSLVFRPSLPGVGLCVLLACCQADTLTLPEEGDAAHISIVSGNHQQGQVAQPLADSLVVSVTDQDNRPVVGQVISFNLSGGTITPAASITSSQGKATFHWTLGPVAGTQSMEAGIAAVNSLKPKVTLSATATPGPVSLIQKVSGNGQTAQVGTPLPEALVVVLTDDYGNPVSGADVVWQANDGNLNTGIGTTDAQGQASAVWTLGPAIGSQSATARPQGTTIAPETFSATATQAPPPHLSITTQPSSTASSGVSFAQQPEIQLEDSHNNPIAVSGVAVVVAISTGGGSLGGTTTATTDQTGLARFPNLFITGTTGDRTLIFAAAGYTAVSSTPITITGPAPSPSRSTISASPHTVVAGGATTVKVTAKDANGQAIAGLPVVIAATGSGNTITQPGVTDSRGEATGTITCTVAEVKTISAQIDGVLIAQTEAVTVVPGPAVAATTTASVPNGRVFQFTDITITTRDAFGNPLTTGGFAGPLDVAVSGANSAHPNIKDNKDGTYTASYFAIFTGTDTVTITFNGAAIQGSPYTSIVN